MTSVRGVAEEETKQPSRTSSILRFNHYTAAVQTNPEVSSLIHIALSTADHWPWSTHGTTVTLGDSGPTLRCYCCLSSYCQQSPSSAGR